MIFLNHIPKSGGTSLGSSLQECFEYEEVFTGLTMHRLGWSDGRAGEYIRLAPQDLLDSFKFVGGHLGESARKELFSERFCIALARDPRSRFVSLIRHLWRDATVWDKGLTKYFRLDKTIKIDDEDEFMRVMMKTTTMFFFVDKPWKIAKTSDWRHDWARATKESIANIEEYDLCITTENLAFYEAFIREALGSPSAPVRERLNSAEQVGDTTGDAIKEELGKVWDKYLTRELDFYKAYKAKSDAQRAAIEEDRGAWLYWMRGRLAKKQLNWIIDWDGQINGQGWSERALPSDAVFSGRRARLMINQVASVDAPLELGLDYKLRAVFRLNDASHITTMRVRIDGQDIPLTIEQPQNRAPQNVLIQGRFKVPSNAANTRIEFDLGQAPPINIWCMDISASLHPIADQVN